LIDKLEFAADIDNCVTTVELCNLCEDAAEEIKKLHREILKLKMQLNRRNSE
jgi:hypothetical protein